MDSDRRARALAAAIRMASRDPAAHSLCVTVCPARAPLRAPVCPECDHHFTGDIYLVERDGLGRRIISERALHHLAHGSSSYEAGDIIDGCQVRVEIDLADWEDFLGLPA